MDTLTVTFKTVTPLFLGGADPNCLAELRAPSIKGALRFWYRAIDPDYNKPFDATEGSPTWEEKIFGSSRAGQCSFLLRVENTLRQTDIGEWNKARYEVLTEGSGSHSKNGVIYCGFPLEMGGSKRKYIAPSREIRMRFVSRNDLAAKTKQALLSSIWLLGHLGGFGFRSRRGFGSVALAQWTLNNAEITELPLASNAEDQRQWLEKFIEGKEKIKAWFQPKGKTLTADHAILSNKAFLYLFSKGSVSKTITKEIHGKKKTENYQAWEGALNEAGLAMQNFRQRRPTDYHAVKAHLAKNDREAKSDVVTPQFLDRSPERASFGLPLTFRYGSLQKPKKNRDGTDVINPRTKKNVYHTPETTFAGALHERSASPLIIRIVQICNECYPLYIRMDAPLLATGETVGDTYGGYPCPVNSQIIDDFCRALCGRTSDGKAVTW